MLHKKLLSTHLQELLCCRRESHADALQEKSADQMSMMYIQTVEAELRKFRYCFTHSAAHLKIVCRLGEGGGGGGGGRCLVQRLLRVAMMGELYFNISAHCCSSRQLCMWLCGGCLAAPRCNVQPCQHSHSSCQEGNASLMHTVVLQQMLGPSFMWLCRASQQASWSV